MRTGEGRDSQDETRLPGRRFLPRVDYHTDNPVVCPISSKTFCAEDCSPSLLLLDPVVGWSMNEQTIPRPQPEDRNAPDCETHPDRSTRLRVRSLYLLAVLRNVEPYRGEQ
jgi:hypothetical protein